MPSFLHRLFGRHDPIECGCELTAADAPLARHPFGDVCQHGVQFLNECDECPGGWQQVTDARPQSPSAGAE